MGEQSAVQRGGGLRKSVGGLSAPRTPRRTGAEGWVFAGEMRVSVQLAYKVPVLGPQDRRLLRCPRPSLASTRVRPSGRGLQPLPRLEQRVASRTQRRLRRLGDPRDAQGTWQCSLKCAANIPWGLCSPGGGGPGVRGETAALTGGRAQPAHHGLAFGLFRVATLSLKVGRTSLFLDLLLRRWVWMWCFSPCGVGNLCLSPKTMSLKMCVCGCVSYWLIFCSLTHATLVSYASPLQVL